jgi:hypothetical protein
MRGAWADVAFEVTAVPLVGDDGNAREPDWQWTLGQLLPGTTDVPRWAICCAKDTNGPAALIAYLTRHCDTFIEDETLLDCDEDGIWLPYNRSGGGLNATAQWCLAQAGLVAQEEVPGRVDETHAAYAAHGPDYTIRTGDDDEDMWEEDGMDMSE